MGMKGAIVLTPNTTTTQYSPDIHYRVARNQNTDSASPDILYPAPPDNTPNTAAISAHSPEALAEILNFNWSNEEN